VEEDCARRDCIIPLGGKVGFVSSLELRGRPVDGFGLWLAAFSDVGRVWAEAADVDTAADFFGDLVVSVGGGIRYDLSIGRLRLDFAVHPRPWTDDYFRQRVIKPRTCETLASCPEEERREPAAWAIHFGIGESF
jgi:outer membrane protein assembly factor BamA